jgi:hypothetical protein
MHCDNCAPEFFCWSGKSTCAKRQPAPACTSIEGIISETERMVGETYHNPRPPAGAVILSLATQVFLLRKALNHIETGAPSIVPEIPWRDYGNPRQG